MVRVSCTCKNDLWKGCLVATCSRKVFKNMALATASMVAIAYSSAASSQAVAEQRTHELRIAEGSLRDSLLELGDVARINIFTTDKLVARKRAPAIVGAMNAEEALSKILAGSGLTFRQSEDGSYIIVRQAEQFSPSEQVDEEDYRPIEEIVVREEIIVTGTKLRSNLQEVDSSVEVFDEVRLDREEVVDLLDIIVRIPNVSAGSGLGNDFSIRGIGRNGVAGAGNGIASNVYVDGSPISPLALLRGPLTLWDVGQVEVLRGPQSSVQGRNALAGAIVISTNDPTYEPEARLRATYGRFDDIQIAGALSGPIIEDQVAARIAVDYQSFDGFITHAPTGEQANKRSSLLVRGKLLIEPEGLPDFSTKFTVDYAEATLGDPSPRIQSRLRTTDPALQDFDFFDFETFGPFIQNQPETLRVVNETTYDLAQNWLLRGIITYENTDVVRSFDLLDGEPLAGGFTRNTFENEIFSAEARVEFDYVSVKGFIGGYYYDEASESANFAQDEFVALSPLAATADPIDTVVTIDTLGNSGIENYAVFGQVEWDINEHWRLNFGFRYDNERVNGFNGSSIATVDPQSCVVTVPGFIVGAPLPAVTVPCQTAVDLVLGAQFADTPGVNQDFSDSFEAFLPRAAITYSFDEDHSVFFSYQRGYRAGGGRFILAPSDVGGVNTNELNTFDPEFLDTFEIGTRNVLLDGQLVANANIFYSKYTDQQAVLTGPIVEINALDDFIVNAGESTLYGAEISLDYTLDQNWNFYTSLGLLQTEFDDFEFAETGPFQNLAGNEFPFAPNVTFSFSANYQHESGFYGSGTVTHTGSQFTDSTNLTSEDFAQAFADEGFDPADGAAFSEKIESWTDLTLRIGFRTGRFNFFAAGTNLLNVQRLRSRNFGLISSQTGQLNLIGNVQGLVVPPRGFRIGMDVEF